MTASARSAAIVTGLGSMLLAGAACHPASSTSRATLRDADGGDATGSGVPCGALECMQYDSPREAFLQALARAGAPLVLGIGEVHAPKGATVPSAAARFTGDLLPTLAGRASDLLLELMMPPSGCASAVAEVRRDQEPVTSRHAETAPDEYVVMGERARALGMVPDTLRPTCADMDAIEHAEGRDAAARAGEGSGSVIEASLATIARLSRAQAARLVDRDALSDADSGKIVVLYGGALHNDLSPSPEAARWSYAPELDAHVHGRFAAIDLVVPEFIGLDETWARLPWWPHYDRTRLGRKATLFRTGPQSFVLVFPVAERPR
jgi:hypothetical protein